MKKIIALLLALICLSVNFAGCDKGDNSGNGGELPPAPSPVEDFEFEPGENGLTVTKYLGSAKKVVIPSIVDNKKVVDLKSDVFGGNVVVEEIVLSDYMTGLYLDCFKGCDNLKTLTCSGFVKYDSKVNAASLPDSLTTMIFPSLKEIDVETLDAIHNTASHVNTFICNSATKILLINFRTSNSYNCIGGYNIVLPTTLINYINNQTAYSYTNTLLMDYPEEFAVLDKGYSIGLPYYSYFDDGTKEPTDKSEINSRIVNEIELFFKNIIKKDFTTIDTKFDIIKFDDFDFDELIEYKIYFELVYEISDGAQNYISGWFSCFEYDDQLSDETFYGVNIYEYVESSNDPNVVMTTAFGRVDSITVNGTTYSYDHE